MEHTRWFIPATMIVGLALGREAQGVTITWTGGAGTNSWHTAGNWDLGRVPVAGDDVVIPDMTPNVNVTYSSGGTTINSLTSAEAVTLTNGAATVLTIAAASTLNGPFFFNGGLAGTGNVTVNGPMTWTGFGTMSGTGRTIIASSGSLTISDSNPKTLNRILENHSATANWTNGNLQMNNGVISNEVDGTFTVNLPTSLNFSGSGSTNAVNNFGTLNLNGAVAVTTNSLVQFNNTGTVNLNAGGLFLNGGGTNAGTIDADAGTTLTFNASYIHGGNSSLTGLGTLTFSGAGTHSLSGTLHTDRIINITNGAIVNFNSAYTFPATVNLNATLSGLADVTMTGTLNWSGFATMSGSGKTIIASGATVNMSGTALNLNRRLENHSANFTWTSGNLQMNGGALINEAAGVISTSHSVNSSFTPSGSLNSVTNVGTFNKSGAATMTVSNTIPFTNNGTLNIQAGTLSLVGGLSNFAGTTLTGGTYNVAGAFRFANANVVTNSAHIHLDGPTSAIQNTSGGNGLANFAMNTAACTFQIKNGRNFSRSGSFTNAGQLTIGPGDNTFSVDTVANSGTLSKPGAGTCNVTTSSSFSNNGTIDVAGGTLILSSLSNQSGSTLTGGTYIVAGELRFTNANIETNAATIVLDGPAAVMQDAFGSNALGNLISNAANGSLHIKNGRNLAVPGMFVNQGQVRIGPGDSTLSDTGNYVQTSGATTLDGGTLDPADLADIQGGELMGSGQILGNVKNAGACKPGFSPGNLAITGDYIQTPQGTYDAEIGGAARGTGYDHVSVEGRALLPGALEVTLINGFVPEIDDSFDIMTGSVSVKFATIELPLLPDLKGWEFENTLEALRVKVVDCGPGDADGDGIGDACERAPDLSWHTIDGGGKTFSSGGEFRLGATIGQPDAGTLTGGDFELIGGFWAAALPGAPVPGDCDGDGDVKLGDFELFSGCLSGPGIGPGSNCECADLDADGDVDVLDFAEFQVVFD